LVVPGCCRIAKGLGGMDVRWYDRYGAQSKGGETNGRAFSERVKAVDAAKEGRRF
jgi:hypothetical protein